MFIDLFFIYVFFKFPILLKIKYHLIALLFLINYSNEFNSISKSQSFDSISKKIKD